jgi:hypothetical protein
MHTREMREHFKRIYPECSANDIENLVSAITSYKYWNVHSKGKNALYAVALTQAKVPFKDGFRAKSTAPKPIVVSSKAAKFCRRGRILIAKDREEDFKADTVVEWPVFLRLIRHPQDHVHKFLVENPNPPVFLNSSIFKKIELGDSRKRQQVRHKV